MTSLTGPIKVVGVIFHKTISMHYVSINGMITERPCSIGDLIRRRNEISIRQAKLLTGAATLLARSDRLEIIWEAGNMTRRRANWRRCRRKIVLLGISCRIFARVGTEVGGLVHVDPETVDIDAVLRAEEAGKLVVPPGLSVGVKPVGVNGHTGPNGTYFISRGRIEE